MGKHDKQVTKTVEKSDTPQPETDERVKIGDPFSLLTQMKRNADAAERIAVAHERLADRFAPEQKPQTIPVLGRSPNPSPPDEPA